MKRFDKTVVKTTESHRLELDTEDVLRLIRTVNPQVPLDAAVYVQVPGGGDWSNTSLDIEGNSPLVITWTTSKEENYG